MGAIVGFVLGYVLGTRAGQDGYDKLVKSWKTLSTSEELKDLLQGGVSMAGDLLGRGRELLAERLQTSGDRPLRAA